MANQTGIQITIKAWLPTGKTLDEQFEALSIVKNAHATSDYAALLKAAKIEGVQTEQKTRRFEDQPQGQQQSGEQQQGEQTQQQEQASEQAQEPAGADNGEHPLTAAIKADRAKETKPKAA